MKFKERLPLLPKTKFFPLATKRNSPGIDEGSFFFKNQNHEKSALLR